MRTVSRIICLAAALVLLAAPLGMAQPSRPPLRVVVYINVDEMAVLWGFRDKETKAFPKQGDERFAAYKKAWDQTISEVIREMRKRMPRHYKIFPSISPDQPFDVKINMWVADMPTSCGAPTYYKFLWTRTEVRDKRVTTNWDQLGVRSDTLIDVADPLRKKENDNAHSWQELWAQVPYLRIVPAPPPDSPGQPDATPVPDHTPVHPETMRDPVRRTA